MAKLSLTKLTLSGSDPSLCRYLYNGSDNAPYVAITFNSAPGMTKDAFASGLKQGQSNVQPVSGVADSAFSRGGTAGGSGLSPLSGDTVCSIVTTVPTTTAGQVALAKSILGS
jgi:hypothetical protein